MLTLIREFAVKCLALLGRLLNGPPRAGWRRSTRRADDLDGR